MLDNIRLKYLFDQQNLNSKHSRWLSFLSEYNFEKNNIRREENKVTNALIRRANFLFASKSYELDMENEILNTENSNLEYQISKEKNTKNEQNQVKTYFILNKQGLLLHEYRLYIQNIE